MPVHWSLDCKYNDAKDISPQCQTCSSQDNQDPRATSDVPFSMKITILHQSTWNKKLNILETAENSFVLQTAQIVSSLACFKCTRYTVSFNCIMAAKERCWLGLPRTTRHIGIQFSYTATLNQQ